METSPIDWTVWLTHAEKIVAILGILVGGIWVYINFIKGRIYRPRLEQNITARLFEQKGAHLLLVNLELKNIGLSRVSLQQEGSGLRLFFAKPLKLNNPEARNGIVLQVDWERQATFSALTKNKWIESKEVIVEQQLLDIPPDRPTAFKLEWCIVSSRAIWKTWLRGKVPSWTTWTIVEVSSKKGRANS